jgi:hypothetical protein
MSLTRTLLAVLALAPTATAAELATLDGRKMTGEIVAITGNELTFKAGATEEKFLVTTLHSVNTGVSAKAPPTGKHVTVELTDGSLFRCSDVVIKGTMLEMKLLGMSPRTLPVLMRDAEGSGAVYAVNREAGDAKLEQDFRTELGRRKAYDVWVKKDTTRTDDGKEVERLDGIAGTFGEGDAAAGTVKFTVGGGKEGDLRMTQVAGLILNQKPPKAAPPPAICKVIDADGNEYVAAVVARTDKGYALTTVSGMKADLESGQVSKFDFAAGSVKYLSDVDPVAVEESGSDPEHYQRDKNLDRQPIRLVADPTGNKAAETYPKGLTLKAKTVLTYELKGQYKSFRALAGVEASVETQSQVRLTIDDGTQVLYKGVIKRGDKPVDLNLSVQNVDRLKITVETDGQGLDLGNQLTLANARVLK